MPEEMPNIALTDAVKKKREKKYPLPDWCKNKESRRIHLVSLGIIDKDKRLKNSFGSNKNKFLSSPDWKLLRDRVLHYYGAICMKCGSIESINIDHIKPRSKYPELEMEFSNLQVLCWTCNRIKNVIDETDYRPK